ncbi:NUDIX domain-containing protein [Seonamhaeicola sediminis]|uniref:NUDIX domain-containing protein n=1 Tax=Seonamhaeicola sediminis TaxID=2528206 RepID=A0A562YBZ0_9FLAO|nr:NUDIX domain-containing protein [Seonamhaeicola sediminis]TWO31910.1 NUDIX domain-containing protein [Seonamhaeicola sediminis]
MDELIDVVDTNGNLTGQSELKSVIHQKGLYHNTAHIWFYTKNGQVLLSQRSAEKTICPLMWDVSVAGHIDSGETIEQAAIRETLEEISLSIIESDLNKIGVFKCFQNYDNGIKDFEFHNTFIAELHSPLSVLIPQKGEVDALKLVSFKKFQQLINTLGDNGNHFVPSNKSYYEFVLKKIIETVR